MNTSRWESDCAAYFRQMEQTEPRTRLTGFPSRAPPPPIVTCSLE